MKKKEPVGPCWKCGDPNGYFRAHGAATPVHCDKCEADYKANTLYGAPKDWGKK